MYHITTTHKVGSTSVFRPATTLSGLPKVSRSERTRNSSLRAVFIPPHAEKRSGIQKGLEMKVYGGIISPA
jgi:hypothetical protein